MHVTASAVVKGVADAARFNALGSSATPMLPGVAAPAVISSHETAGVAATE
jgi:hypothetical protein